MEPALHACITVYKTFRYHIVIDVSWHLEWPECIRNISLFFLESSGRTANNGLSFPIILTIALVGIVLFVAVVVVLVRFLKPLIHSRSEQPKDSRRTVYIPKPSGCQDFCSEEKMSLQNSVSKYKEEVWTESDNMLLIRQPSCASLKAQAVHGPPFKPWPPIYLLNNVTAGVYSAL